MAQWKETLEPYVKVQEVVKTRTLNPTAGEDLIIGCVLISDAGPSVPTLISSQKEFINTYASQEVTEDYVNSLNNLYSESDSTLAATMWANGYRLAGSNTMLVVRASKADDVYFSKPLTSNDENTYILRDGELLKKVNSFKITLNVDKDGAVHTSDGWNISVNGVGVIGNRTTDDGAQYDYFTRTLPDLVNQLNETSKFFSPDYDYFNSVKNSDETKMDLDEDDEDQKGKVKAVVFNEVYLAAHFLDKTDSRAGDTGVYMLIICEPSWGLDDNIDQKSLLADLNVWTDFEAPEYYAINRYNSATDLKVRIRRFNHDAVVTKELSSSQTSSLTEKGESPYMVLKDVLATFTSEGKEEASDSVKERDFFEVAIWDASINDSVSFFNIGNISGRGDMSSADLNDQLSMIQLQLPDDMHDLGLDYYGYDDDNYTWKNVTDSLSDVEKAAVTNTVESYEDLLNLSPDEGTIYKTTSDGQYYKYIQTQHQVWSDLGINTSDSKILTISDSNLKKALDLIELDEVYTTEGLCDLGNTETSFQSYMANMAVNSNFFYPISTINSTNYMAIGNSASKISKNSYKLYMSAPWDVDTSNLGWKYYASPSVLYWEAVSRNRGNNEEFRGVFGQVGGIVQYQKPVTEFNKKTRQLLLSKKVNTVLWNTQTQAWNMNDNYTKQSEDTIMSDEGNSRLMIRISKAMPSLLKQFIGRKISDKLCSEVKDVIDYFFKTTILSMSYSVDGYQIFCDYDEDLAAQNKIKVVINVRYQRSLKYINVVNNAFDVGMDISSAE